MSHVDSTETITHVSLCAGYAGIDLGIKRAIPALRTVAFCEIEAFACANLVSKMEAGFLDAAPIWTDLKSFPWAAFHGRVGILSGGYPCQPFSAAGKRLGKDDPRHLWPWIADGISAMRPGLCFFENVEGHISLGLSTVLSDLEERGYRCAWGIFSAAEVGAPHQRKRVFILAHRIGTGLEGFCGNVSDRREPGRLVADANRPACAGGLWPARPGEQQYAWEPPRTVGDATSRGLGEFGHATREGGCGHADGTDAGVADAQGQRPREARELQSHGPEDRVAGRGCDAGVEHPAGARCDRSLGHPEGETREQARVPLPGAGYEVGNGQIKSPVGRNPDGAPRGLGYAELCVTCDNRTDELRLLGNGVVPAVAHKAFVTLMQKLLTQ